MLLRRVRLGIAVSTLAGTLAAKPLHANIYCFTSGGFSACASATVTTNGSLTELTVAIQNLSNASGAPGNTIYSLTGFGLYYLQPPPFTGAITLSSVPGGAGWTNGQGNPLTNPGPTLGPGQSVNWLGGALTTNGVNYGLIGCAPPPNNNPNSISTCAGPVNFVFSLSNTSSFSLANLNFAFRGQSWQSLAGGITPESSFKCYSTDANCTVIDATAIPEPATMGLMALGLVGIGGAGLLRRHRNRTK